MDIEEATEKCKMFINNRATIQIIQSTKESINFATYDTTPIEVVLNKLEKKEKIIKALVDYLIEGLQTKSYEEKICIEDILNKIEKLGYEFENPCNMRNMFKNVTLDTIFEFKED